VYCVVIVVCIYKEVASQELGKLNCCVQFARLRARAGPVSMTMLAMYLCNVYAFLVTVVVDPFGNIKEDLWYS